MAHDGVVAMGVDADIVDDGEAIAEDVLHHAVAGGQGGDAVDDGIGARLVEPSALLDPPVGDVRPRDEGEGGDAFPALHEQVAVAPGDVLPELLLRGIVALPLVEIAAQAHRLPAAFYQPHHLRQVAEDGFLYFSLYGAHL